MHESGNTQKINKVTENRRKTRKKNSIKLFIMALNKLIILVILRYIYTLSRIYILSFNSLFIISTKCLRHMHVSYKVSYENPLQFSYLKNITMIRPF